MNLSIRMKINYATLVKSGILTTIIVSSCMVAPLAFAASNLTTVRGNVYNESNGGSGIQGLLVYVSCVGKNNKAKTRKATTDSNGLYSINFKEDKCEDQKPVTSTVTFNGQTQSETVYVSGQNTATLDFYFGAASVPEFNAITGALAAILAGGAYLFFRRKTAVLSLLKK